MMWSSGNFLLYAIMDFIKDEWVVLRPVREVYMSIQLVIFMHARFARKRQEVLYQMTSIVQSRNYKKPDAINSRPKNSLHMHKYVKHWDY